MPPLGWRKNKDGKQPSKKPGGKKLGRPPKRKQLDSDDDEEDYGSMGLGVNKKQMKRNRRPKPDQDARIKAALAAARFDEGDLGEAPLAPPPPLEDEQVGNGEGEGKGKAAEKDTVVEDEDEDDKGGKGEGEGASSEEDDEAEVDAADEEALAEGRAAGVEFSKELYESLTKEQLARYELYRRSALGRSGVRKVMQSVLMGNVAHQPTIVMSGLAKMLVGELTERARTVSARMGHVGPVRPAHIREAYRQLRATRAPTNEFPVTTASRAPLPGLFR